MGGGTCLKYLSPLGKSSTPLGKGWVGLLLLLFIVYKSDPLASTRDKSFTIQNALFGAMQITKNATDNDKNNYKEYGICFDERSEFGHTITEGGHAYTTDARNVLIFGADMSFSVHATNRANHIYLMGTGPT